MIRWKHIIAGGLTFLATHAVEIEAWPWFDPAGASAPWFLNAGRAVAFTAGSLVLVGAGAGAIASSSSQAAIVRGGYIAAGAIMAMTVALFARGAGTLFPIALVFGAVVAITSSVCGALVGWRLASARGGGRRGA